MVRFGVLGAGRIGNVHARTIAGSGRASVAYVADAIPEAAQKLAATVGAKAASVDEIIAAFAEHFDVTVELAETAIETEDFPVMRVLRDVARLEELFALIRWCDDWLAARRTLVARVEAQLAWFAEQPSLPPTPEPGEHSDGSAVHDRGT